MTGATGGRIGDRVGDREGMIAAMAPELRQGAFVFVGTTRGEREESCRSHAVGMFLEAEGWSFILPVDVAGEMGFDISLPMCCIALQVYSALDGVGLTAAVSGELARHGIPCNMVAAFHHDHIFVPMAQADRAMALLQEMQRQPPPPVR